MGEVEHTEMCLCRNKHPMTAISKHELDEAMREVVEKCNQLYKNSLLFKGKKI
jgi:hypothetical protein